MTTRTCPDCRGLGGIKRGPVWEICEACLGHGRDTRQVPVPVRPVPRGEWEREFVDEGVSHVG